MELFEIGFFPVSVIDILDILLVSYIIYKGYKVVEGTIASRMLVGLVIILLFSVVARLLNMHGMIWLFEQISTVWVIAFVIIFQPELRRVLISIGQSNIVRSIVKIGSIKFIDELVGAVLDLSRQKKGAIIAVIQKTGLKNIIETGVNIQARLSTQLLLSIFDRHSPLHDGAVIAEQDSIIAARCLLPLSQNPYVESTIGTRHRAGLGLSEQSDAVVIIVSEESGKISIAYNGVLKRNFEEATLRAFLNDIITGKKPKKKAKDFSRKKKSYA